MLPGFVTTDRAVILSTTAERYGQRPSDLLAIPPTPENLWLRLCIDEAVSLAHTRHDLRRQAREAYERKQGQDEEGTPGSPNLYTHIMRDPKVGRPPDVATMQILSRVGKDIEARRAELGLEPESG